MASKTALRIAKGEVLGELSGTLTLPDYGRVAREEPPKCMEGRISGLPTCLLGLGGD